MEMIIGLVAYFVATVTYFVYCYICSAVNRTSRIEELVEKHREEGEIGSLKTDKLYAITMGMKHRIVEDQGYELIYFDSPFDEDFMFDNGLTKINKKD